MIRAAVILQELASRPEGASVTDLAALEGVNKALTARTLNSLVAADLVRQDEVSSWYRLTPRLLALANQYYIGLGLGGLIEPILRAAADPVGCNAEFTSFVDGTLRILAWVAPKQGAARGLQVVSAVGDTQAPHATAAGKVWLASLDAAALESYFATSTLARLGPNTITDPSALRREVTLVRRQGYAVNNEEDSEGVFAIAVPVVRGEGRSYAASLSLTRPAQAGGPPSKKEMIALATAAAGQLSKVLPAWLRIPGSDTTPAPPESPAS